MYPAIRRVCSAKCQRILTERACAGPTSNENEESKLLKQLQHSDPDIPTLEKVLIARSVELNTSQLIEKQADEESSRCASKSPEYCLLDENTAGNESVEVDQEKVPRTTAGIFVGNKIAHATAALKRDWFSTVLGGSNILIGDRRAGLNAQSRCCSNASDRLFTNDERAQREHHILKRSKKYDFDNSDYVLEDREFSLRKNERLVNTLELEPERYEASEMMDEEALLAEDWLASVTSMPRAYIKDRMIGQRNNGELRHFSVVNMRVDFDPDSADE